MGLAPTCTRVTIWPLDYFGIDHMELVGLAPTMAKAA